MAISAIEQYKLASGNPTGLKKALLALGSPPPNNVLLNIMSGDIRALQLFLNASGTQGRTLLEDDWPSFIPATNGLL